MENMDHFRLKHYVQTLYRRIQIACALAIIKQRPLTMTPESFAATLQSRLKLLWLNNRSSETDECLFNANVEQNVLKRQQQTLTSRLLSLLPANELQQFQANDEENFLEDLKWEKAEGSAPSATKDEDSECLNYSLKEKDVKILMNAEFVRSIVQLKTLTELHTTIPVSKCINILSKKSLHVPTTQTEVHCLDSSPHKVPKEYLPDSGISSCNDENINSGSKAMTSNLSQVSCVTSSIIQYIISSCSADHLVTKSVEAIVNHLKEYTSESHHNFSAHSLHCVCTQWKFSINEYAVAILQRFVGSIVDDNPYDKISLSYMKDIVCDIILETGEEQGIFTIKEDQCAILLQLCWSRNLCIKMLDLLLNKIHHLASVLKENGCIYEPMDVSDNDIESGDLHNVHTIERSYYLLLLAKNLVTYSKNFGHENISKPQHSKNPRQGEENITVAELWRKRYVFAVETEHKNQERIADTSCEDKSFDHLKERLEQILIDLIDDPLISFYIGDCIDELALCHAGASS